MNPKFEPLDDGLEIIDPIERHRYQLTTHEPVDPTPVDTDRIKFPVDNAVEIETRMITLPSSDLIYVRDGDGLMVTEVRPDEQTTLPESEYFLDLSGPMKIYAHTDSSVNVYSDNNNTYISFGDQTRISIGARSFHTRPAETITTSPEPRDVMKAVTAFGAALKTTSPERSYPTLRGHPPNIKIGDEFEAPRRLQNRNTGIRIEVPPTLRHVFSVTPLTYYLGAEIVPGPEPRILTDNDYSYSLVERDDFEKCVAQVLKRVFFLDCIVRTEGSTPLPLYERQEVESDLEFDIEKTYDQPAPDRLETYLQVPFTTIEPHLPNWQLEVQLEPIPEIIEFLPFIANNLSIVKIGDGKDSLTPAAQEQAQAIEEFVRGSSDRSSDIIRSSDVSFGESDQSSIPTIRQSWEINESSVIESTTPLSAYQNSIGRKPREDPIEIKVVCNDSDMREELKEVNGVYGTRNELPFDVTVYYDLTKEKFKSILASESDLLHYIGHIDEDGFQCADGKLDGSLIDSAGMKAFLLNACQSYEQGLKLIKAGSIGGIVTFDDVINSGAINVGSTIARLLNRGYPLYAALDIVRENNIIGEQYRIVGDGITTIAQSKMGGPNVCSINEGGERPNISINTYITSWSGRGSIFTPYIESIDQYYLSPGIAEDITVTRSQLEEYLKREQIPVVTNREVRWSEDYVENEL